MNILNWRIFPYTVQYSNRRPSSMASTSTVVLPVAWQLATVSYSAIIVPNVPEVVGLSVQELTIQLGIYLWSCQLPVNC